MYWYSVGDAHLFFEWINYFVWSIYDPMTDTHISPRAVKEGCICIDLRSTPGLTGSCFFCNKTNVYYCIMFFFCMFSVVGVYLLCCYFYEKARLCQKEKKLDHSE